MDTIEQRLRRAAELGVLCANSEEGGLEPEVFVQRLTTWFEADGGALSWRDEGGGVASWFWGLDRERARRLWAGGLEPQDLSRWAPNRVCRLTDLPPDGDDLRELLLHRLGVERCVRVSDGEFALHLCRFVDREPFPEPDIDLLRALQTNLRRAAAALAAGLTMPRWLQDSDPSIEPFSEMAPLRCPVPLVLVDGEARVVVANPAARRKLDILGHPPSLPDWLHGVVKTRLEELVLAGGIPEGVSGDYQFVEGNGRRTMRVGLVPVESAEQWLLSLEHGGPTIDERVFAVRQRFGLTEGEREILELLVDGMTNAQIADAVGIVEATVKYRLGRIMEKTETHNRTELMAAVYSERPD